MPTYAEKRFVPYRAEQMFTLVADIEKYPQFLPWCHEAQIRRHSDTVIVADLKVGSKLIRHSFCSWVHLTPTSRIDVSYSEGPFRYLQTSWIFQPCAEEGCHIDFRVEFAFNSWIFEKILHLLFNDMITYMVRAFELRAKHLYANRNSSAFFTNIKTV